MSAFVRDDGQVVCPLCHVMRFNMKLMLHHLTFWHDMTLPNARKVERVILDDEPLALTVRRDGREVRLWIEVPLPGF